MHEELKRRLRKKKNKALTVYALFLALQPLLLAWLILDFKTETQVGVFCLEVVWALLLYRTRYAAGIVNSLSPLREGVVVDKYTRQAFLRDPFIPKWERRIKVGYLAVAVNGRARELRLQQIELLPLYEVGDRILFSDALAAPLLLDRREGAPLACPCCGAILPPAASGACPYCARPTE